MEKISDSYYFSYLFTKHGITEPDIAKKAMLALDEYERTAICTNCRHYIGCINQGKETIGKCDEFKINRLKAITMNNTEEDNMNIELKKALEDSKSRQKYLEEELTELDEDLKWARERIKILELDNERLEATRKRLILEKYKDKTLGVEFKRDVKE